MAVIVDGATPAGLSRAVAKAARLAGAEVVIRSLDDENEIERCFAGADVFFILSGRSISYTSARLEANRRGARGISWNSLALEQILRLVTFDYEKMQQACAEMANVFERAATIGVRTGDDYVLTMNVGQRRAKQIAGRATEAGSFSQIGGVVGLAPLEGTALGSVRALGSVKLGEPADNLLNAALDVTVEDGRITAIAGDRADAVRRYLERFSDDGMKHLGVLGVGLNPKARICGSFGEDERVAGLVHLTFGTNTYHGGTIVAKARLDICLQHATLEIDGKPLEEKPWL